MISRCGCRICLTRSARSDKSMGNIMRASNYFKTFLLVISAFAFVATVSAQDTKPPAEQPPEGQRPAANQPQDMRTNMLHQLGLSREQIQQIRRLNAERKPLMVEAQKRFREANRFLDEAIYADQFNDKDFQDRLKDFQLAQVEVARLRFLNELSVRQILTPEQLQRFRDLRQRFEQRRDNMQNQRPRQDTQQPLRQIIRSRRQVPNS